MPRGGQVGRWLVILDELRAARLGIPAELLARRHGWQARTVYRDLRALEDHGFPVTSINGRWRLVEGWRHALPAQLTAGERVALGFARRLMAPLAGTRVGRDFEALYQRVAGPRSPASPRQGELFARLGPLVSAASPAAIDYREHHAVIETLCAGCEAQRTVRAIYFSESRRERTTREIAPYHLHWDARLEALYLIGWCHERQAVRTFAVHRFRQAALTQRRFAVPADFSVERYLRGAFRIWRSAHAVRVRLALAPEVAGWVGERRWHASQVLHRLAGGGAILELTVDASAELERFILQLGPAAEVLDPLGLRTAVAAQHRAAAARYRRGAARKPLTLDVSGVRHSRRREERQR